jgi:NADH-quinone oxidoreductase subunit L
VEDGVLTSVGVLADADSTLMLILVALVSFLVQVYSLGYLSDEPPASLGRYYAYQSLFAFSMMGLVLAPNFVQLFICWELVGLCSYLLIGYWYARPEAARAAVKAFWVTKAGDVGFLIGIVMLWSRTGTFDFSELFEMAQGGSEALTGVGLVMFCIYLGAAGKSAQFPFHVWLPDAMEGPTPVSALIHAATMVTAGVYLIARMSAVFVLSPAAMAVVAITGALTALFAASIGLFQNDLKKVLAYSTVSQLGYMFIGVGVGAFAAGFFHVFTHAFFKACLFLGAGSVIHAMHARIHDTDRSQDMRNMGGLRKYMPLTRWTFLVACCSIAGLPGLAGFWSKDEILWKAFSSRMASAQTQGLDPWRWPEWLGPAIYWLGVAGAVLTAFYMFRAYFTTFHGEFRGWKIVPGWAAPAEHDDHGHGDYEERAYADSRHASMTGPTPHESPPAMTIPLIVLAVFSIAGGFFMAEPIHVAPLAHELEPVFKLSGRAVLARKDAEGLLLPMMLPGVGAFLAGSGAAMFVYWNRGGEPERRFADRFPRLHALIYDKWRIDELYDATVVGMVDALADIFTMADKWFIDGILAKLTAALAGFFGTVLRAFQTGRVQVYAAAMVLGLAVLGWHIARPHAAATVDASALRRTGEVKLSAAPGLGYEYRWDVAGAPEEGFSKSNERTLKLEPGETKEVMLRVRNAWGSESKEAYRFTRPARRGSIDPTSIPLPQVPTLPSGTIPAERIPDLLKPGGLQ